MNQQLTCLRCKQPIDPRTEQCPHCGERVTAFQRTYSTRLLDGKYQIIDRLGVGGMGEIFKVRHIHLNELRVIKIMRPNVAADDQGLQRFLQEARTSTMIKHKNLAMLYDFAQLEDGSYYMVWEFIDGTNIQRWIAEHGPVPPRLAIEMAIQALHGLEHLHSMDLIHRDISPENIMLSQDPKGKLLVKVIDFGIAKQLAEGEGGHGLTQTGMFLGKLKYASPEQAGFLKEGEHLDPRSDLYSFGIVMYEMLAGRAPFQATNPHGYILKHVTEMPAPIAEMNPSVKVPPTLESIVMRSLEKSRDVRFASAADFATALDAIRNTIPPDPKFGLGEKMITLSGAQTLADLPKVTTGAYTGGTVSQAPTLHRTAPGGTSAATVIERGISPATMSDSATVVERQLGPADATVVERLAGNAAPTVIEAKPQWQTLDGAAPTVVTPQMRPAGESRKKNNVAMIGGIAAAVVAAIVAAVLFLGKGKDQQTATSTGTPAAAAVTATAPSSGAPVPGGKGALLLSASPWGDIEQIMTADMKPVDFPEEAHSTPARIDLAPGDYQVTIKGPNGPQTIKVSIQAGKQTPRHVDTGGVDVEGLVKEMNP